MDRDTTRWCNPAELHGQPVPARFQSTNGQLCRGSYLLRSWCNGNLPQSADLLTAAMEPRHANNSAWEDASRCGIRRRSWRSSLRRLQSRPTFRPILVYGICVTKSSAKPVLWQPTNSGWGTQWDYCIGGTALAPVPAVFGRHVWECIELRSVSIYFLAGKTCTALCKWIQRAQFLHVVKTARQYWVV